MDKKKNYTGDKRIEVANIGDLCTTYMRLFGANNNLMRHLPSLSDGLKPVARRILWAMYNDLKSRPNKPTTKVARIKGEVLKYHPHGDASVSDTVVRLAQPWNNIQVLIEGVGNFGSISGAKAAADRYINARISKYAYKCFFEDFNLRIINTKMNYLGSDVEPEFLPARYPNVLINHSFGIGYGMSTGIPTYNLREVLELTIKLLHDPLHEDITLIPDIPTGADVIDEGQFKSISETGKGKFRMRGHIEVDTENNRLTILSVPIQVTAKNVKEDIIALHDENKIRGIIGVDDDSSEDGIRIHIYLKKEIDPLSVLHTIYKRTQMEKTDAVNFKLIDDYQDFDYNIRSLLLDWIDFRRDTKRKEINYLLTSSMERKHIIETILMVIDGKNAEKSLDVIRKADSRDEVIQYLMKEFGITSLQAKNIADMKLSAFSKKGIKELKEEFKEIEKNVKRYNKLIRSNKKIDESIEEELLEGIELFGEPRRSKVITVDGEVKVSNTNHVVVFTMNGFIKKLPEDATSIGNINQNDYPIEIIHCNNMDDILIFDETGKITKITLSKIPNSVYTSEGENLSNYGNINGKIAAIKIKPTMESLEKIKKPVYFIMATKNGLIKKTNAAHYVNIKNELLGMIVKEGDELQGVKLMVGDSDILVYTSKGFGARFASSDVKDTARMSTGVKALSLADDETLIGVDIINPRDRYLFCLTNKGTGKKCTLEHFRTMDRASKPLRITTLNDGEEVILIKTVRGDEVFRAYMKNSIEEISIEDDVTELPRLSKGKKLFGVKKGEVIIDIKEVKK